MSTLEIKPFNVLCINSSLKDCPVPSHARINGQLRPVNVVYVDNFESAAELLRPKLDFEAFKLDILTHLPCGWDVKLVDNNPVLVTPLGIEVPNNLYLRPKVAEFLSESIETQWDGALKSHQLKPFNALITEEIIHLSDKEHSANVRWGLDLTVIAQLSGVPRIGIRIKDHSNLWPPRMNDYGLCKIVVFVPGSDWEQHAVKDLFS